MPDKSILLLDDDADDCFLFQDALNEVDATTDLKTINSCDQLMTILRVPGTDLPDLIVMDLNIPKQNGFECLEWLKVNRELKDIPVVILSTCSERESVEKLYKRGAMHYITKPNTFQALKEIVTRLVTMDLQRTDRTTPREKFLLRF